MIINGFGNQGAGGDAADNNANVVRNWEGRVLFPTTLGISNTTNNPMIQWGDSTTPTGSAVWANFTPIRTFSFPANTTYNLDGIATFGSGSQYYRYKILASIGDAMPEKYRYVPCIYGVYLNTDPNWTFSNETFYAHGCGKNAIGYAPVSLGRWPFSGNQPTDVYSYASISNGWTGTMPFLVLARNASYYQSAYNYYMGVMGNLGMGIQGVWTTSPVWGCSIHIGVFRYADSNQQSATPSTPCTATNANAFTVTFGFIGARLYQG